MSQAFDDLVALVGSSRLPPVDKWNPTRTGEIDIRIRGDGVWFHEGREITRTSISKLFSTVLVREDEKYFLTTPYEKLRICVDDAPFVVVDYESKGNGRDQSVVVKTNFDECVFLDAEHPIFMRVRNTSVVPYVAIRSGLEAVVNRSVYYRMAEELVTICEDEFAIWSCGTRFVLQSN